MFPKLELTHMAQALASHAGARMGTVAANLANADTPGYRAQDLPAFAEVWRQGEPLRATRPGHLTDGPGAGQARARDDLRFAAPNGNSVSVEAEMVKSAAARQDHDMALAIYRSTSDILRTSLGRGR